MPPAIAKYEYKKEQKVGEGQYAIVYLGKQSGTNRKVAIKSIKIGQFKDGKFSFVPNNFRNGHVCNKRN
jgi:serine/threonine protein kinase